MRFLLKEAPVTTRYGLLKTDPSAWTSSLPPGRAGGGWAFVFCIGIPAAEAVSQFPGPPLEDPPTSPPHEGRGRSWGERGGTSGARAADSFLRPPQRRGRCDSSSGAAVAAQAATQTLKFGVTAAGVTPREPQANDWRGGRAGLISSSLEWKFQRPGIGLGE